MAVAFDCSFSCQLLNSFAVLVSMNSLSKFAGLFGVKWDHKLILFNLVNLLLIYIGLYCVEYILLFQPSLQLNIFCYSSLVYNKIFCFFCSS